jgi:hypothetical protein
MLLECALLKNPNSTHRRCLNSCPGATEFCTKHARWVERILAKTEGYAQYAASDDEPNSDLSGSEDGEDENLNDLVETRPGKL